MNKGTAAQSFPLLLITVVYRLLVLTIQGALGQQD
jgi:hypothetical protein